VKHTTLYFSLCISIALSTTQTGCSMYRSIVGSSPAPQQDEVRRATAVKATKPSAGQVATPYRATGARNPDSTTPSTLPPGVRVRYSSVHTDEMVLAMTFDDGPHPANTPKLLDILKERNIKATFFLVGANVKAYPALVRRIIAEGHEVANHTWTHASLTSRTDDQIRSEFQRTADALRDAAGYTPKLMRPPYGATNKRIEEWVFNEFGYASILWSVDPQDWRRPGVSVVQSRLLNGAHKGAILLCHDIHAPTITAMPKVFDDLLARGYRFVTVSQLINLDKSATPVGAAPAAPANQATALAPSPSS
jgi:peptidoglycan/xylan/chitin deacetylase (PgdA/CDA1 family)